MNNKKIRIGTRNSDLALWQANYIKSELQKLGHDSDLIEINTKGDQETTVPLYEFGVTGIFTKSLDIALLENRIDLAVHSMKDVPVVLPQGISEFAIPKRGLVHDVLVYKGNWDAILNKGQRTIATSSLRRKAQWLNHFAKDTMTGIRGNVNTRLAKLQNENWDGAIFAEAGLKRIEKLPPNSERLEWMIPAAAQGALLVVGKTENKTLQNILAPLTDTLTQMEVHIERQFMHQLNAGCTAPVGAIAKVSERGIKFKGVVTALDGSKQIEVEESCSIHDYNQLGTVCARQILKNGADRILAEIQQKN